jgi:F420-dependent methylenetetrahydromethanopterin dehydrogenase
VPIGGDFIEVVSPTKPGTTAGRLMEKRGDGGYMIIMQTEDAKKRREHIEAKGLSRVIFEQSFADSVCIQYHPKGIKGTLDT